MELFSVKAPSFKLIFDDRGSRRFIGIDDLSVIGGTWTKTRIADGDFVLRKTAAADTTYVTASLRPMHKLTPTSPGPAASTLERRGFRVNSVSVIYGIATANLTSQTGTVWTTTYANNTANVIAAHGGTLSGTLAVATQANPYVSVLTLGTPVFADTALQDVRLQIAVVAAATSVYDIYGLVVNYNQTSI